MRFLLGSTLLLLTGCASLAVHTEGTSGPIAWRVDDIAVVTRQVNGKPVDGQAFVLVLKNTSDRTLTLTRMEESRYRPQTGGSTASYNGSWMLRPGGESRFNRFTSLVCNSGQGCTDSGANLALFRIIFTGTDDGGQPVEARMDITLPAAAVGRPPIVR
jgi:hypothetical protein